MTPTTKYVASSRTAATLFPTNCWLFLPMTGARRVAERTGDERILLKLAKDPDEEVRLGLLDWGFRVKGVLLPRSVEDPLLTDPSIAVRTALARTTEDRPILDALASDSVPSVRAEAQAFQEWRLLRQP
jgi:hypothetical protein